MKIKSLVQLAIAAKKQLYHKKLLVLITGMQISGGSPSGNFFFAHLFFFNHKESATLLLSDSFSMLESSLVCSILSL